MKIKLELYGASRDFSNKDHIEFQIKEKTEIKNFRKEIIYYTLITTKNDSNINLKWFIKRRNT